MNARWEYLTLKIPTDVGFFSGTDFDISHFNGMLNAEGAEGWELVSVLGIESGHGSSKFVVAVMKRMAG